MTDGPDFINGPGVPEPIVRTGRYHIKGKCGVARGLVKLIGEDTNQWVYANDKGEFEFRDLDARKHYDFICPSTPVPPVITIIGAR